MANAKVYIITPFLRMGVGGGGDGMLYSTNFLCSQNHDGLSIFFA